MIIAGEESRTGYIVVGVPEEHRKFYGSHQEASDAYRASSTPGRFVAKVSQTRTNNRHAWVTKNITGPCEVLPAVTTMVCRYHNGKMLGPADEQEPDTVIEHIFYDGRLVLIKLNNALIYDHDD